jgi:hypothetical protein
MTVQGKVGLLDSENTDEPGIGERKMDTEYGARSRFFQFALLAK